MGLVCETDGSVRTGPRLRKIRAPRARERTWTCDDLGSMRLMTPTVDYDHLVEDLGIAHRTKPAERA